MYTNWYAQATNDRLIRQTKRNCLFLFQQPPSTTTEFKCEWHKEREIMVEQSVNWNYRQEEYAKIGIIVRRQWYATRRKEISDSEHVRRGQSTANNWSLRVVKVKVNNLFHLTWDQQQHRFFHHVVNKKCTTHTQHSRSFTRFFTTEICRDQLTYSSIFITCVKSNWWAQTCDCNQLINVGWLRDQIEKPHSRIHCRNIYFIWI